MKTISSEAETLLAQMCEYPGWDRMQLPIQQKHRNSFYGILLFLLMLPFVGQAQFTSWTIIRTNAARTLVVDTNDTYYLVQNYGVAKSTDQGKTWTTTSYAPTPRDGFNTSWGATASPYGVFVGAAGQGIWRSTDSGSTWANTFSTGFGTGTLRIWRVESSCGGLHAGDI